MADDGPGFDPGVIDHVFERFRRGDRSGSVGLGMAIARTVVDLHGGRCLAANRSDGDGGGALVTIRLPYKPALRQARRSAARRLGYDLAGRRRNLHPLRTIRRRCDVRSMWRVR